MQWELKSHKVSENDIPRSKENYGENVNNHFDPAKSAKPRIGGVCTGNESTIL